MVIGRSQPNRPRATPSHPSADLDMSRSTYTIESVTSEEAVLSIREDWDRLSATAEGPNVFTTFEWFEAWYRCFAQREGTDRLRRNVFVLKSNCSVCGIAPLTMAVTSQFGVQLRRLQFAARNHEWDYNDLFVGDDLDGKTEALAQHLSRTKGDWDLVDLMDVRDTDNAATRIRSAVSRAGLYCALLPAEERCPYLPIDSCWDEMLNRRSSATRHSFRNRESKLRRIAGEGLRMRIVDAPHVEPGLLERMVALEAQKRSGGVLSVPFIGQHKQVFESVVSRLGPKGWLSVALLEWGERLLSWHLLFRCGGKLWGYMTAYDHEFARLSPGNMLIPAIIDYGFARGFTEYDFLSGEESYKMQWATDFHQRYRILIWNGRWKSRLYSVLFRRMRARRTGGRAFSESDNSTFSDHGASIRVADSR